MNKYKSTHSLAIWPTLPLNVHFRPISKWRPFPLNQEGCRTYSLARHAICNACRAIGLGSNDVVLVPAYHHGSEIEALLQAGLNIRYYEVDKNLEPDPIELQFLILPEVRALYIIHYLGFPQNAGFWRQWCDDRNLLLIEDAAQAFLAMKDNRPVGSFGQMGFFCLYKTYGIPDGGTVISTHPPIAPAAALKTGLWKMIKRHVNYVAARRNIIGFIHLKIKPLVIKWNRKLNVMRGKSTKEFELGDPSTPATMMTTRLLPKILDEKTATFRRENYLYLLKHLGHLVPSPFAVLPEGACPFAFPIKVDEARSFLERLRCKGVMGLLFWLNPHPSLPVANFPRSKMLRERVLALPVHQELTMEDLEQIVNAVQETITVQQPSLNKSKVIVPQPE